MELPTASARPSDPPINAAAAAQSSTDHPTATAPPSGPPNGAAAATLPAAPPDGATVLHVSHGGASPAEVMGGAAAPAITSHDGPPGDPPNGDDAAAPLTTDHTDQSHGGAALDAVPNNTGNPTMGGEGDRGGGLMLEEAFTLTELAQTSPAAQAAISTLAGDHDKFADAEAKNLANKQQMWLQKAQQAQAKKDLRTIMRHGFLHRPCNFNKTAGPPCREYVTIDLEEYMKEQKKPEFKRVKCNTHA